jgi:hypothetical protein
VTFRDRLFATIRAARPVLEVPDVLIVGSEVPNLLESDAASTLVVSQDLDIGVPIAAHAAVKDQLDALREFTPSPDEPSVWIPRTPELLELNFLGIDASREPLEAYVFVDDRLPLLVFGALGLVSRGRAVEIAGTRVALPRPAGLLLEKLVTDRTGEKGERDLLVAVGILGATAPSDLDEFVTLYRGLRPDVRHMVRSNLTIVSLLQPHPQMPDPAPLRARLAALLTRLEAAEEDTR